mmetsp:Transcript_78932/g.152421  ORF Transcript_78932/g.152421 Transcript_78932/m.152421 type:complete len:80 (-) Transcript_78932:96-335(-)
MLAIEMEIPVSEAREILRKRQQSVPDGFQEIDGKLLPMMARVTVDPEDPREILRKRRRQNVQRRQEKRNARETVQKREA